MKYYSMTDVGRKREINQDYVFATDKPVGPFPNLLVVADGMGGHKAGDFASKYTVNVLREELENSSTDKPGDILKRVVVTANKLYSYNSSPTIWTFAKHIETLGAKYAYTLDGGQTATISMNGKSVNPRPNGERWISDIIYWGTAIGYEETEPTQP